MKAQEMLLCLEAVCVHTKPVWNGDPGPCQAGRAGRASLRVPSSFFERPLVLTYLLRKLRPQNGFRTTIGVLEKKVTKGKCIQNIKSKHVCKHFIKGEFA